MSDLVIQVEDLVREYDMGAEKVLALRGLTVGSAATSTSPSWDPRVPVNPLS